MDKIIKNILKKIEINGFEAYLVGGFVRDSFLGIKSNDIDICTNALPKDLHIIFKNVKQTRYGNINIKIKKYNFDITTYRANEVYKKNRMITNKYVNNLLKDLQRRDFTINALVMNSHGDVIDLVDGLKDLKQRKLRVIGNTENKIKADSLRILRAIRLATTLNLTMEDKLIEAIKNYKYNLTYLSPLTIRNELDMILLSKNLYKGINIIQELEIDKILGMNFNNLVNIDDLNGLWAQITLTKEYPFTKVEKEHINNIQKILKYDNIDNVILFDYGLFYATIAGSILGIDKKTIYSINKKMKIHNIEEIAIKPKEIIALIQENPSNKISIILNDLKEKILNNNLKNNKKELKKYIEGKWKING